MSPKDARAHWKVEPDEHDYAAAKTYLSLFLPPDVAANIAERLRGAPIQYFKAKDLLRASRLKKLSPDNVLVAAELRKIKRGERLSPVLLVRGQLMRGILLTVADGHHRICASYAADEDADIPCRLVDCEVAPDAPHAQ
ncbi:MAG: hypothetical protein NVSMB2_24420 [Chloroflexota bacterium]